MATTTISPTQPFREKAEARSSEGIDLLIQVIEAGQEQGTLLQSLTDKNLSVKEGGQNSKEYEAIKTKRAELKEQEMNLRRQKDELEAELRELELMKNGRKN